MSIRAFITILILFLPFMMKGQENTFSSCESLMNDGYVSDGKEHIAKLDENNKAVFHITFYGGSNYRLIACSDYQKKPLILTVYDTEKNRLFCNADHKNTPFWNFIFTSTVDCIVEIEIDAEEQISTEVMLLIGFKEK